MIYMIDQNTIIELINSGLPILASSPVLIKLIECVENLIKTFYAPALTLKEGKAKVDIELYRKQNSGELLANQNFTLYEITKLKNFINSANFASEELANEGGYIDENNNIDFDWIIRFFDAVGNVSNQELQKLWGKVLAGEIKSPGTCSLRTMDIIHNMSQKEAEIFDRLSKYVLKSGDCYFILNNGFLGVDEYNYNSHNYILKTGLNHGDDIIPMIESGLLSVDNSLATDFKSDRILTIENPNIICFIIADEVNEHFISLEPYFLTRSGIELYNIIQSMSEYKADIEYSLICFRELKNQYQDLIFSAHRIIGVDDFDPNNLL